MAVDKDLFRFLSVKSTVSLREKARMPRAVHGDEWPMLVWGREPPNIFGFFF